MTGRRIWLPMAILIVLAGRATGAVSCPPNTSEVKPFLGVWVLTMTNPQGAQETVRVWDNKGTVAASVQAGRFPPIDASGVFKDGDILVLSLTRFENGKPVRSVISLALDGDTMRMAQMLEFSETIKRGSGKRRDG